MEIVHQLPGRVRFRIPELDSIEYCHGVLEWLKSDARIKSASIKTACNSLTVYYDAAKLNIEDIFDLLSKDKKTKPPAVGKKPVAAAAEKTKKPTPPAAKKKPISADGELKADEEKAAAAALVKKTKNKATAGAPKKKPAVKRAVSKPRKRTAAATASKKAPTAKKKRSPGTKKSE
jgi:hypothetical protein